MPVGNIYIRGIIGSFDDENGQPIKGVELVDVVAQLQNTIDCESLDVYINSPGGICDIGYKIFDLLRAQKKPIRTIVEGECCSIATVIYLAGDTREPIAPGTKLMIHNPWLSNVSGNADQLLSASEQIRQEEEKMISFYSKVTGVDKSLLSPLMSEETYLSPEQSLQFNFSTKTLSAIAFKRPTIMSKEAMSLLSAIATKLGITGKPNPKKAVAVKMTDSAGLELDIQSAGEMAAIGDPVMIDGQPAADGDYTIPDTGLIISVAGGLITAITDPAAGAADEGVLAENVALKAENEDLKAQLAKAKEFETETTATLAMIQEKLGESYTPPVRKQSFAKVKTEAEPTNRVKEAAERKKAYK